MCVVRNSTILFEIRQKERPKCVTEILMQELILIEGTCPHCWSNRHKGIPCPKPLYVAVWEEIQKPESRFLLAVKFVAC